jgi:polar amino acid transport system substrate-binding protein
LTLVSGVCYTDAAYTAVSSEDRTEEGEMRKFPAFVLVVAAIVALIAAALSASSRASSNRKPVIKPPAKIAKRGTLQVCVDISYPPAEYYASNGSTPKGTDIDMSQALAKLFGVRVQFVKTPFASIIAALQTRKCDVIVSALTDTALRRKQVAFVDYLKVQSAFLVQPNNPKKIHKIADLCGRTIAIIAGENWKPFLEKQSSTCSSDGNGTVAISEFNTFADELSQLGLGRVDAIATSTVNGAYIVRQPANKGHVALAKPNVPYSTGAWGMAVTKDNKALRRSLVKAVRRLIKTGALKRIFVANGLASAYIPAKP